MKRWLKLAAVLGIITMSGMSFVYVYKKIWNLGSRQYSLKIEVDNTGSLALGTPVLMNGVRVGSVKDIFLGKSAVVVDLAIDNHAKIPIGSEAKINYKGMIGDLVVNIFRAIDVKEFHKDGDVINGAGPISTGVILEKATSMAEKLDKIIGDISTLNIGKLAKNIETFTEEVNKIVKDFRENDKDKISKLVDNLNETVENINLIVAGDDIQDILGNTNRVSGSLAGILDPGVSIDAGFEAVGSSKDEAKLDGNFGVKLGSIYLAKRGFEDWKTGYTALLIKDVSLLTLKGGMMYNSPGGGFAINFSEYFSLGANIYDLNDTHVEVGGTINLKGILFTPRYDLRLQKYRVGVGYNLDF